MVVWVLNVLLSVPTVSALLLYGLLLASAAGHVESNYANFSGAYLVRVLTPFILILILLSGLLLSHRFYKKETVTVALIITVSQFLLMAFIPAWYFLN